jgi:hypothetical protein
MFQILPPISAFQHFSISAFQKLSAFQVLPYNRRDYVSLGGKYQLPRSLFTCSLFTVYFFLHGSFPRLTLPVAISSQFARDFRAAAA